LNVDPEDTAGPDPDDDELGIFACRLRPEPLIGLPGYPPVRRTESAQIAEERERLRLRALRSAELQLGEALNERRRRELAEVATRAERRARRAAELQLGRFRKDPET
jgi:hypothetical protein